MFKRRKTEETVPEARQTPSFRFQPAPPAEPGRAPDQSQSGAAQSAGGRPAQGAPGQAPAARAFPIPPAPSAASPTPAARSPLGQPRPPAGETGANEAAFRRKETSQPGSAGDGSPGGRGAEDDWGVPPYRPAPAAASASQPPRAQETQTMARTPFPVPPPAPAATPRVPPGPGPGPAAGTGHATAPNLGAPNPATSNAATSNPGAQTVATSGEPAGRRTLVVGRGISVQGTVQDAERLVVEGTVEASMIHAAELLVAPGGVLRGEVQVENAELAGTVDGTLTARASLVIRSSGRLLGTARYRSLQVEEGGRVTGRLEMLQDEPSPAAAHNASPPPQLPEAVEPRPAEG